MIILIAGEKGGTGKTTIATNIATKAKIDNRDILLVDTDKQGSASAWAATREFNNVQPLIPIIQKYGNNLHIHIQDLATRYQDIIIDAGGRDSAEMRSAMLIADKVYVPIQASQFDIWTITLMNQMISEARIINAKLEAFVLINRGSTHSFVNEIMEANDVLLEFDNLKPSSIIIKDRIAYRKAAKGGLSVVEVDKGDDKAKQEVLNLYAEVFNESNNEQLLIGETNG